MLKKTLFVAILILLLAACAPTPPPTTDFVPVPPATDVPTQAVTEAPIVPTEAPTQSGDACPAATADLKLVVSTEDRFCLLYPAEFTWDGARMIVLNPVGAPGDVPGEAWLLVSTSEAGGQTAAQIADAEIAAVGAGFEISRVELTVGGQPAILVDGLPAQDSVRYVYVVNSDRLYRFEFMPWFPQDGASPLERLYQSVVDSIRFLPTGEAVSAPSNGCSPETDALKLLVNSENGFCLLHPAEFTWDGRQMVVLNPNPMPGDLPGEAWLDVQFSEAGGQTVAQIVDAELAALGGAFEIARTDLTIDGKPAILLDGLPAQDSARFVYIVHNDRLYRFGFLPWYPQDGATPLEKLYQSVVDTLHFLP